MMKIETNRLIITDFTLDMARDVHLGSMDADMERFLPDEVFPTEEIAQEVIRELMDCYAGNEGPFVHPVLLRDGTYVGYVQMIPTDSGWEVGYHVVKAHTGKGYASEALTAFLPDMMDQLSVTEVEGVCLRENAASIRVLEKCGFRRVFEGEGPYQGQIRAITRMIYNR